MPRMTQEEYDTHQAKIHKGKQPEQEGVAMDSMRPQPKTSRGLNGTEQRYVDYVLKPSQHVGEVTSWMYEGLRFKLAGGAHYTPDFNVWYSDGRFEQIEIKGGIVHEASIVRIKVAREVHSWTVFRVIQYKNKTWTEIRKA